ncbi:MAG: zf-HC2 domain-containing protein [Chloroflexota bacterium]|nr:zf-HC2 domain-containing protein [Chloroflexota bacterium]
MYCRASHELMSLRLDGHLDPPAAARLDSHLAGCAACRARWTALREADRVLRQAARHPVTPSLDFAAKVMSRVALTPAVRPSLWERERVAVQGGRPTIKLHATGPISGRSVPLPGTAALVQPRGLPGLWDQFRALYSRRMGLYLGGLSVAGALSLAVLMLTAMLWTVGNLPLPAGVQSALTLSGHGESVRTWVGATWTVLADLVTSIDPWVAGAATAAVSVLGALWWRIVAAFARRAQQEMLA